MTVLFSHQSDHAAALQAHEHDLKMRESHLQKEEDRLRNWAAELEEADRRTKENHLRAKEAMDEARKMRRESLDLAAAVGVELDQRKDGNDTLNSSGSSPANAQLATGSGATNPQTYGRESGATPQQWAGGSQTNWQHTTSGGPPHASGYQQHTAGPPHASGYQQHIGGPPGYQINIGNRVAQNASSPQLRQSTAPVNQSTQVIPIYLSLSLSLSIVLSCFCLCISCSPLI